MLLPGALVTFLLILFALGLVVFLAFRGNDGSLLGAGFTLANFVTVATDPLYLTVTLRSLAIAGLVTLATVVTAYPVAYYLAFTRTATQPAAVMVTHRSGPAICCGFRRKSCLL